MPDSESHPTCAGFRARQVDKEDVLCLARIAGLDFTHEDASEHATRLEQFLASADAWQGLGLAFSFDDGVFSYVPSISQFCPEWQFRTALNKSRVAVSTDSAEAGATSGGEDA